MVIAVRYRTVMALDKDDWIRAALIALAEGGVAGVAVERLAAGLGATKGSFYWHFRDRSDLVGQALTAWESDATDRIIAELGDVEDPVERLRLVMAEAMEDEDSGPIDVELLSAARDPQVAEVVARVQAKRLAFLERCFSDLGFPPAESRHRGRLAYSAYLGWFDLVRTRPGARPSNRERAAYQRSVVGVLTSNLPR